MLNLSREKWIYINRSQTTSYSESRSYKLFKMPTINEHAFFLIYLTYSFFCIIIVFQSDDKNGMSDPGQKGEQVVVQIELLKPKDQFVSLSLVKRNLLQLSQP